MGFNTCFAPNAEESQLEDEPMLDASVPIRRHLSLSGVALGLLLATGSTLHGQITPPASTTAASASRQRGTVKAIAGSTLTLTTDEGQQLAVTVTPSAKIVQLAPGSTDLKAAQPITLNDVTIGDRILVVGTTGTEAGSFSAGRVILMKSTDIAAQHAREEADWQRRGTGGLVGSVDSVNRSFTISARGRGVAVKTTASTTFRRYAGDSVKFEDAKRGSFDQLQAGDQVRIRGNRSADAASIDAEEIVSGSFQNLSGKLTAVDASAGTVVLTDLATKRTMTVSLTANSAIHVLPPDAAMTLAARPSGSASSPVGKPNAGAAGRTPGGQPFGQAPGFTSGQARGDAGSGSQQSGEGGRRPGGDLSQTVARLPRVSIAELHVGDAVLVVASPASSGSTAATAITLVSGVQSILAAAQGSAPAVTLSPWSLGGAPADGGGQ